MDALTFATSEFLGTPVWLWLTFITLVGGLLAFDLGVLHRDDRVIGVKESLCLSAAYIGMGLAFGAWVWWHLGADSGMEYLTAFLVEKTLALDNIFAIAMLFSFFAVPLQYQHRVLFWGVLGVIVLRAIMIGIGAVLIARFAWVLYVFGAFLTVTGIKMLLLAEKPLAVTDNVVVRWLRSHLRVTDEPHGHDFFVKLPAAEGGPPVWWATPLLLALVSIEFVDVIFAVDSIPAVFAITQDPFIVYTSNIFAILGLRALYFALAAMVDRFTYLNYALALVLVFIGAKIIAVNIVGKLPAWISLGVTVALLLGGVLYSLHRTRGDRVDAPARSTIS